MTRGYCTFTRILPVVLAVYLLTFSRSELRSQPTNGVVQGVVRAPSGAAIPSADVTAIQGGAVIRSTRSDGQGRYVINGLSPGAYVVRISAPGFAAYEGD